MTRTVVPGIRVSRVLQFTRVPDPCKSPTCRIHRIENLVPPPFPEKNRNKIKTLSKIFNFPPFPPQADTANSIFSEPQEQKKKNRNRERERSTSKENMFSRRNLLESTRRCFHDVVIESRSRLDPSQSLQHSRAYIRSPFLRPKHGVSDVSSSISSSISSYSSFSSSSRTGFVTWYLGMIESRPVITKGITAGIIFTAADVSSQV